MEKLIKLSKKYKQTDKGFIEKEWADDVKRCAMTLILKDNYGCNGHKIVWLFNKLVECLKDDIDLVRIQPEKRHMSDLAGDIIRFRFYPKEG